MKHDYLADRAANFRLMQLIRTFWSKRGHAVNVWLEKGIDPTSGSTIWVIRSNIQQNTGNIVKGYVV